MRSWTFVIVISNHGLASAASVETVQWLVPRGGLSAIGLPREGTVQPGAWYRERLDAPQYHLRRRAITSARSTSRTTRPTPDRRLRTPWRQSQLSAEPHRMSLRLEHDAPKRMTTEHSPFVDC